jgi:Zn-dependent protease
MLGIDLPTILHELSIIAVPGVLAITMHEVAHGWVARLFGDSTAAERGRLSLNPLRHVDPIGTVVVPTTLLLATGGQVGFGWAKPVPVDKNRLRRPRRDMIAVALAGPASNLLMATVWAALCALTVATVGYTEATGAWLAGVCIFGIWINALLAAFNLLPIPPLDGSRVVLAFLPKAVADRIERFEIFGLIIVVALLWYGWLGPLVEPVFLGINDFFSSFTGLA